MRAFVAIDLPTATRDQVEALLSELRREVGGVRWARIESVHLTLKFLGEVEERRLPGISEVLERRGATVRSGFAVGVKGVGTFGERSRPRVVWSGLLDPEGGLARLAAAVEEGCAGLGFPRESRPFRPHLTLARLKGPPRSLAPALAARANLDLGEFRVTAFHLFQSLLHPQGAKYVRLAEYPLGVQEARAS